jgi:hypothetical protein
MELIRGHENYLTALDMVRLALDEDFCFSFQYLNKRIERGFMLAQALTFIE